MKKVILSVAIIASVLITTNVQSANVINEQPSVEMIQDDDGFVDVKFEDLNEVVRISINAFADEYTLKALKYNAELQVTKVELIKKEDRSDKIVYLNVEGKEVPEPAKAEASESLEQETPSVGLFDVMQDNGFVNIKFDELNEKVQKAVRALAETYDVTSLRYNTSQSITEVKGTSKSDQIEKKFYLNAEGEEVEQPASHDQQQQQEATEVPMSL